MINSYTTKRCGATVRIAVYSRTDRNGAPKFNGKVQPEFPVRKTEAAIRNNLMANTFRP